MELKNPSPRYLLNCEGSYESSFVMCTRLRYKKSDKLHNLTRENLKILSFDELEFELSFYRRG